MKLGEVRHRKRKPRRLSASALGIALCLAFAFPLGACSGISADLQVVTALYEDARYEHVQQWVAVLQTERSAMSEDERLRFHYLAGMAAYRLGQGAAAHHHLALAAVLHRRLPRGLSERDGALLRQAFSELSPASK